MDSMTRMFPMTVIRLRAPATATIRTISTAEYGLAENAPALLLLLLAEWNELSILPGASRVLPHRRFSLRSSLYLEQQKACDSCHCFAGRFICPHSRPGQARKSTACCLGRGLAKEGQVSK